MNPLVPVLGSVFGTVADLIDDLHTSDKEKMDGQIELAKLGLEEKRIETELVKGQIEVNKTEAQHANIFVAGWRPAIGWIGAASMAYQFIIYPLLVWGWSLMQANGWVPETLQPPPMLDTEALWVILSGMLGIAGMRSVEKVKGVSR